MTDPKWTEILKPILASEEIKALKQKIAEARQRTTVLPAANETFEAFNYFNYDDLKMVIIGPEPYNDPTIAHGLAFSSKNNYITEELSVIFKEIHRDIYSEYPYEECFKNYNLMHWASQGVLLLNVSMTVESGVKQSHQNIGWDYFLTQLLTTLNGYPQPIVFMLMSTLAHPYGSILTNATEHPARRLNTDIGIIKHLLIKSTYPSLKNESKFLGKGMFGQALQFLTENRSNTTGSIQFMEDSVFQILWSKIKADYTKNKYPLIQGLYSKKVNIFDEMQMRKHLNHLYWYPYHQILNLTT